MTRQALGIALVAGVILAPMASAGNGVDPATIVFRDWQGKRPASMSVIGCPPRMDQGGVFNNLFGFRKYGVLAWAGQPGLSQQGSELMRRNGFTEVTEGNTGNRNVVEIKIGDAKTILATVAEAKSTSWSCEVTRDQLRDIPAGVTKAILLHVDIDYKARDPVTRKMVATNNNEVLTMVFEEGVSDDDLRQIAYEDGVLRAFGFREDP